MKNRKKKHSNINYDKRMTFLGAKHPFSWLAIKQRSQRAVVISSLGACIYVYIEYMYTRTHTHTRNCQTGRLSARVGNRRDVVCPYQTISHFLRRSEGGIREKDGLSAWMHLCTPPKPVASILEARTYSVFAAFRARARARAPRSYVTFR